MNQFKTFLSMLVLTVVFVLVGSAIGGKNGAMTAFLLAGAMNFFSYWFSDKLVLRMYGAQQVTRAEAPELYQIVGESSIRRAAHAQDLYHGERRPQCLRHGKKS